MGKMGKKRKLGKADETDEMVLPPKHLSLAKHITNQEKRLIIILERAQLESVKVCGYFCTL